MHHDTPLISTIVAGLVLAFIFGPTPLMRRPGRSRNRISRGDDRRGVACFEHHKERSALVLPLASVGASARWS